MKDKLGILEKKDSVLLVIDIQEKFRAVIFKWDSLIKNINRLIKAFQILKIPILITEQYPKGLGPTVDEIKENLENYKPIEKRAFSCFNDKFFFDKLKKLKRKTLIICGIESHVCIINTLLDAIAKKFNVHLVVDAISSRKGSELKIAIERAKKAGAFLTTTEMVIFQLTKTSEHKKFKDITKIVK